MGMPKLGRRQVEASVLAAIGLLSVFSLRFPIESHLLLVLEICAIIGCFLALMITKSQHRRWVVGLCAFALIIIPILTSIIGRQVATAAAFEMTALTVFGAGALAIIGWNPSARSLSLSLVISGFLTLFGTVISDHSDAIWIAILWMSVCVWHLVANHWERLELCAPDNMVRNGSVRPLTVILAVVLLIVGGLVVRGRVGEPNRMSGFMPTSGGSEWSDPGAMRGVGMGDAAIAAKDQAESFGAVESELFLESTDSTLFDMFSDSIGQPKRKNKWERRQGMTAEKVIEAHSRSARSDKGSDSFSTDRHRPQKHQHLKDVAQNALVQWSGPTGIRLAMKRYDTFDGVEWTNSAKHGRDKFVRKSFGDQIWFFDPGSITRFLNTENHQVAFGKLKVIRLDSTRVPVPAMSCGVHIKDIDREDFFGLEDDGSFYMPGRERIPPLTVINVAGTQVLEDDLIAATKESPHAIQPSEGDARKRIAELVSRWTKDRDSSYLKLRAIVHHLRTEFEFDRQSGTQSDQPLGEFLESRRGGDHLFATAATLMAREIGLESRLVTGLYVRPSASDFAAGHSNVLPNDVHTWTEIRLSDGRWFAIEPTPGYKEPNYEPSMWLTSKRAAAKYWPHAVLAFGAVVIVFVTRFVWLDLALTGLWWISALVSPRRRLALAFQIIEKRAGWLGHARPAGSPQRDWLLQRVSKNVSTDAQLCGSIKSLCDLADQMYFGQTRQFDARHIQVASGVVGALPMRRLKKALAENQS